MSKIVTAFHLLKNPHGFVAALFESVRRLSIMRLLNDHLFIRIAYYVFFYSPINLSKPVTFNEKLNWLKLYYRKEELIPLVDKYAVKEFVSNRIGEKYVIPTIGVWNHDSDIDWRELPSRFVMKCTHDSHSCILCNDKNELDIRASKRYLRSKLRQNLFYWAREWPYKFVKPRIIAEQYLMQSDEEDLNDYKFFCFNGRVRCFKIDFDRFTNHHANYFNREKELMGIGEQVCPPDFSRDLSMPQSLDEMIRCAEALSQGFPFVRVDMYDVNGRVYFGEMTFFPAGGFGRFINDNDDLLLGSWLELPTEELQS